MSITVDSFPNLLPLEYASARAQIKSGDILLCSGNSIMSSLIKRATNSVWSHVAFLVRLNEIDRIMVLESVESFGVRTVPLSSYVSNYNASGKGYPGQILIARHNDFVPNKIDQLSKYAVDLFGYPYSNTDIIRITARLGMRAFNFAKDDEQITPHNAYICSEYAYECYKSVGITIDYDQDGFIAPADFAKTPQINAIANIMTNKLMVANCGFFK